MDKNGTYIFENGRDHLWEELSKLDALLDLRILRQREIYAGKEAERFGGLLITEDEIKRVSGKRWGIESVEKSSTAVERKALQARLEKTREALSKKIENTLKAGIDLPFYILASMFRLSPIEIDILLICLAPELNLKYEKIYAYLQDDVTKKSPSVNFILDLLCAGREERIAARTCFLSQAPLLRYRLIDVVDDRDGPCKPLLSRCLKLDDRVVNFLLGIQSVDSLLVPLARLVNPQRDWSTIIMNGEVKERLTRVSKVYFREYGNNRIIFFFYGPYGAGKKSAAEAFCRDLGLSLLIADMRDLMNQELDFEKIIRSLFRESLLQPAVLYIENFDLLMESEAKNVYYRNIVFKAVEEFLSLVFFAGLKPWDLRGSIKVDLFIKIEFPVPDYPSRKSLWQQSLDGRFPSSPGINISDLANKFNFTGGQISDAVAHARDLALVRSEKDSDVRITDEDLYQGCRAQSNQKLSQMARKIIPRYSWHDIVLPADQLQQLKEIQNHVKYRQVIYHEWGFGRKLSLGKGVNILFSGPSGTGKTMAADVIANELHLDLYKIDLSCVVSKYIGETEKNLAGIFKEAETSNAILFFDEADALFGKRSEVKDSHDRYANIEIGYLLQKMEEYTGVVILATNLRKNMDEAFVRRMHFTVEFPFPDEDSRCRIWQNIFPGEAPLDRDIDYNFLKRRFKVSGGHIRNIALTAAFYAVHDGGRVTMEHIMLAGKREFRKMGKLIAKEDFGQYYDFIMTGREIK